MRKAHAIWSAIIIIAFIFVAIKIPSSQSEAPVEITEETDLFLDPNIEDEYLGLYMNATKFLTFDKWIQKYGKSYSSVEERMYRQQVFIQNLIKIRYHNVQFEAGQTMYFMGINAFVDLTPAEFKSKFLTLRLPNDEKIGGGMTGECKGSIMDAPNPPEMVNWKNKLNPATPQGDSCGRNYAMVAIGAVESLYAIRMGSLQVLSVQQILECSDSYGNQGCFGGFMDQAFWYMIDSGVATNKSYPEKQNKDGKLGICRYSLAMKFTGFDRCARIPSGSYKKLISAIIQQPVSVALNWNADMQFYDGGVYDGNCTTSINDGMLMTGYGGANGTEYWRLRNTKGVGWGMQGYIHIIRTEEDGPGKCGLQLLASVPQSLS